MKKILSLICAMAIVVGIAILPPVANASSVTELVPSKLHNAEKSAVSGETVYSAVPRYAAGSITFNYEIEADCVYYLSFDYKGGNRSDAQLPKALTVASNTTSVNDIVANSVTLNLPNSTEDYTSLVFEISGEDLLLSGGKYLAINWKWLLYETSFKNFKIVKEEDGNKPLISYLHHTASKLDDAEAVYTSNTWDAGSITFDYKIQEGYTYYLSFDYKGKAGAYVQPPMASTVETITKSLNDEVEQAVSLNLPESTGSFSSVMCELSGNELLASGGEYLAINWKHLTSAANFKNFKIHRQRTVADGYDYPVALKAYQAIESIDGETAVYSLKSGAESPSITFDYQIKSGKTYAINFDYILTGNYTLGAVKPAFTTSPTKFDVYDGGDNVSVAGMANSSSWKNTTVYISSDSIISDASDYLTLCAKKVPENGIAKFRNFYIAERDANALFENGDFELGEFGWKDYGSSVEISKDAAEGRRSAHFKDGNYSLFGRLLNLKANTNYKLSFKYKGTFTGVQNYGVSKNGISTEAASLIHYESLTTSEDWQEESLVFSTGNETVFGIVFQTVSGCDFYIDSVSVQITDEQAEATVEFEEPAYTESEADNRFWHWDASSEETNLIKNGSFDGEGGNWQSLLADGTITLHTTDDAKSGDKVLKFEAQGLEESSKNYLYIECEPKTEYMLSVWHKGENWSDTNSNDLRWGIADPTNGKLIYSYRTSIRGWNLNAWDNEWHRTTLKFNSGKNSIIALAYIGANSVAYIDDLQIFKYDDKVNGRPLVMVQKQPSVTNAAPEELACDADKNVFQNAKFEEDNTYWSGENSMGYKGTVSQNYVTVLDWDGIVEVVDTNSSNGKALYYEEQSKYTGKPLSTSYLKYVDIEPDTEYTFVADFLIEKAGNGRFGLVSVNDFYPRVISGWQTFSKDYFDPAYNWQKFAFTFNSNEFERVAFVVQDKGGKAYIDNIRLFKTVDGGILEEHEPAVPIESDKYEITDKTIILNEITISVADVVKTMNVSPKIRVFDGNGNEITDFNSPVKLGYSFKYMDGLTVLDSVTAKMPGDANDDGEIDIRDLVRIKKILSGDVVKGKYLTVFAQNMGGGNSYFKNFKIGIKGQEAVSITPVTLKKNEVNILEENGETVYEMLEWKCPSMVFDYELSPKNKYIVSFDHKGHNWAQHCVQSFMAAETLNFQVSNIIPEYYVKMGLKSSVNNYIHYEIEIDGAVLTDGAGMPNGDFNLDNDINSIDLASIKIKLIKE